MTREGAAVELLTLLQAPTPADEIKQRQGPGGKALDYVDARFVADRLDSSVGPENWQDRYEDRVDGSVRCGIGILVEGEWVWKWDVGDPSDIEAVKGAHSDAFKRAGVKWGIARDLYGHTTQAGRSSPQGRPAAPSTPRPSAPPAAGGQPEEPEWVAEQLAGEAQRVFADVAVGGACPTHNLAWTLKPGGVSKSTGKPYGAFWACPSTERPFCKEKPAEAWVARQAA